MQLLTQLKSDLIFYMKVVPFYITHPFHIELLWTVTELTLFYNR